MSKIIKNVGNHGINNQGFLGRKGSCRETGKIVRIISISVSEGLTI